MIKKIFISLFLCASFLLQSCSGNKVSPEDEIRQYINTGIEAAENRSAGDVVDLIHETYQGQRGMDKLQVKKLLRLYFFRHKNIYLFSKIRDITFHSENEASVTLYVAMAGSVIADASVLSSLRARIYKFELELIKQPEWLLLQAQWQQANAIDMQ